MDGSIIPLHLEQNLNSTEMAASTEEDGPRILATSYMMYKIGECESRFVQIQCN